MQHNNFIKTFIFSLCLIFIGFSTFAQQNRIDSLKNELKTEQADSVKLKILRKILISYYNYAPKNGLTYADTLISYAKKSENTHYLSFAYRYKGIYHMYKGNFNDAKREFNLGLNLNDSIKNYRELYTAYSNLGILYRYEQKLDSALYFLRKAYNIVKKNNFKDKYSIVYNNIAQIFGYKGNIEKATQYYLNAIDSSIYLKFPRKIISTYNNLAMLFYDHNRYQKSIKYNKQALEIAKKEQSTQGIADAKLGLAKSYIMLSQIDTAKKYLTNCVTSYKSLNDNIFLIEAYEYLGEISSKQQNFTEALEYQKKALKLARKTNLKEKTFQESINIAKLLFKTQKYTKVQQYLNAIRTDALDSTLTNINHLDFYSIQIKNFEALRKYPEALKYSKLMLNEIEQNQKNQNTKTLAELETKYQTEKKEKENLQLKEEKAQQRLQLQKENLKKWLLLGGLLITALVLGIFVFYYRKNKRQKSFIEQLQRELHHRTKNNLAIIDSLIEEIKENADKGDITQRLTDLQNRIGSINEVHKRLHQQGTKLTHINLSKYIDSLANNITNSFDNSNIVIDKDIPHNLKIETAKIFPLGLIINEFITNSFKYAFPKGEQGKVHIGITEENTSYTLSLADNGKGLPTDFDSNTLDSFGIEVMQLLSKQLKGTFDLDGTNGVQLTINFPKN